MFYYSVCILSAAFVVFVYTRSEQAKQAHCFYACMKNRIAFNQVVAIIIVKEGILYILPHTHTHCKGR